VITLSADYPLINSQTTGLEKEHASFVMSLAHEAQTVVSLRLLDTGTAKDVSGVMRITRGGDDSGPPLDERELLYHVGGDGGVRVFERGQ
jgi:elongator complex protein 6